MKSTITRLSLHAAAALVLLAGTAVTSHAQKYAVLHQFAGTDGSYPIGNLIADSAGNLYGVTEYGGIGCTKGCGTVFQLKRSSGRWQFNELYQFSGGSDGAAPQAGLTIDSAGNLYGTTFEGGLYFEGVVYELSPGNGGSWTESVLWSFKGTSTDGAYPTSQMVLDSSGNLYGTTQAGGSGACGFGNSCGTVFELSPNSTGGWTESILYNFGNTNDTYGPNGWNPVGSLVFDGHGNLFGTTPLGGSLNSFCGISLYGCGIIFELTPSSTGWTESIVYTFQGYQGGGYPQAGIILDASGTLYGTTVSGGRGCNYGYPYTPCAGTVFAVRPNGGGWNFETSFNFQGPDTAVGPTGGFPLGSLTMDSAGNLYGSASAGGPRSNGTQSNGTIFELSTSSGTVKETLLHVFEGVAPAGGAGPSSNLLLDSSGNLFGTTSEGGSSGNGVVFRIAK